ncbi:alanyl-tRNA editing protein [Xenorhabdus sp. XENO-10]|uniref:Alanyl-tRNA editing protein n=1 Tax=Xenorhabdus yunnanensis TaxID=3025878 RepID=A0ABT5LHD6_9GAMM|nr:alanyl-tRNA editing protein [Xenorhabdus yunnanensis]MDC9589891.1 alanyl-tRNA editing protein [Xenorhabdus yunnanensis]
MFERLYLSSSILAGEVEILDCSLCDDQRYAVQLKATPFHPQGGGQPSDTGWLNDVEVIHVTLENDRIIHYTTYPVSTGIAFARVDEKRRRLHSQLHSAGHLIGHIVELLGWHPIKAHHWPGESRVTFKSGADAQAFSIEDLQEKCDQFICENLSCQITLRDNGFREVGFSELTPYPCGGTHVESLKQINGILIQDIQQKKGKLSVQYDVVFPS